MAVKDQVPDKYSRSAQNGGLGGDSEQLAAKLAAELVPRAVEVLGEVLEKPTRGSGSQLGAARLIFELSAKLAPQVDAGKPRGELRLIDAAKAAELLQKRLEQK